VEGHLHTGRWRDSPYR